MANATTLAKQGGQHEAVILGYDLCDAVTPLPKSSDDCWV